MNIIKIVPLIIILACPLAGCASYDKTLTAENGKEYHCKQEGFGLIGSLVASSRHDDCVKAANDKGYK